MSPGDDQAVARFGARFDMSIPLHNERWRRPTMKQLVDLVAQKTGISGDQAASAVETVVGFLKEKLPPSIAGQLDRVVGTGESTTAEGGGLGEAISSGIGEIGQRKAG
jgi:hypothetical protein